VPPAKLAGPFRRMRSASKLLMTIYGIGARTGACPIGEVGGPSVFKARSTGDL
jgi:hypothetical protein